MCNLHNSVLQQTTISLRLTFSSTCIHHREIFVFWKGDTELRARTFLAFVFQLLLSADVAEKVAIPVNHR